MSPEDATQKTLSRLEGAFALGIICRRTGFDDRGPARTPLAIGYGDGEMFIGSDAMALAPLTQQITYLEEGDWALVTGSGVSVRDADGTVVQPSLDISLARSGKGGHEHFMLKEI